MQITKWIKAQAAAGEALNLHAVAARRPEMLNDVFSGATPIGWYQSLKKAGVDPYSIVHEYSDIVHCQICNYSGRVLGIHLKKQHGIDGNEYTDEFGQNTELSSQAYRAGRFRARPVCGIEHWEKIWSEHYVIDWILRLKAENLPLNYYDVYQDGQTLTTAAIKYFGSWDKALNAAGFDPRVERAIPRFQSWDADRIIVKLNEFADAKKTNRKLEMPYDLRCAAGRIFGTLEAATAAAGLKRDDISYRSVFLSPMVKRLVAAIRKLETLKGRERTNKLKEIYHKKANLRIIQNHYGSLQKLTLIEGIDPRTVSLETYRDESDVHHDLDIIEKKGIPICFKNLRVGYKRLYNVISETGWGRERLVSVAATQSRREPT